MSDSASVVSVWYRRDIGVPRERPDRWDVPAGRYMSIRKRQIETEQAQISASRQGESRLHGGSAGQLEARSHRRLVQPGARLYVQAWSQGSSQSLRNSRSGSRYRCCVCVGVCVCARLCAISSNEVSVAKQNISAFPSTSQSSKA